MCAKKFNSFSGLVFSTDKSLMEEQPLEDTITLDKSQQKLRVKLDKKQRAGKTVTIIDGFSGSEADLNNLGKLLKTKCGTGGSVKDGLIIIQGAYREKIVTWLIEWGYLNTKAAG